MEHEVVIAAACRTPIGRFQGGLARLAAPQLGAVVLREALRRARLDASEVDEVILGNVLTAGLGQAPARQAAIAARLPVEVPALTINKVCGSGLKAVMLAAQAVRCGDARVVIAGGQESMSNAPYLLPKARSGYRLGDHTAVDSLVHDGLLDVYNRFHMGETGEIVAERFRVTREAADELAYESHLKAARAADLGAFRDEIVPVEIPAGSGAAEPTSAFVERDEGVRSATTLDALAQLRAAFRPGGIVTAGNASQISDGAAAVVVMSGAEAERRGLEPLGRIAAYDSSATRPEWVMEAPIASVRRLLERSGRRLDEIDLFEHNEAFATASCAVRDELGVPRDRFNVHGGAIALGHPIGASGARVLTTLLYALRRGGGRRGVATLCLGGGGAVSMLVERG
jgi:acetyl-CoA C-acetyltransferase